MISVALLILPTLGLALSESNSGGAPTLMDILIPCIRTRMARSERGVIHRRNEGIHSYSATTLCFKACSLVHVRTNGRAFDSVVSLSVQGPLPPKPRPPPR